MRCEHCNSYPVVIDIRGTEGSALTFRHCCSPQWFRNGDPVDLRDVLDVVPKRMRRAATPRASVTA